MHINAEVWQVVFDVENLVRQVLVAMAERFDQQQSIGFVPASLLTE